MDNINLTKTGSRLDGILELLEQHSIYIPKDVLAADDVYEETKTMFGVIFTDCLKEVEKDKTISGSENVCKKVTELMYKAIDEASYEYIKFECFCSISKARIVKSEMRELMETIDLSKCIDDRRNLI